MIDGGGVDFQRGRHELDVAALVVDKVAACAEVDDRIARPHHADRVGRHPVEILEAEAATGLELMESAAREHGEAAGHGGVGVDFAGERAGDEIAEGGGQTAEVAVARDRSVEVCVAGELGGVAVDAQVGSASAQLQVEDVEAHRAEAVVGDGEAQPRAHAVEREVAPAQGGVGHLDVGHEMGQHVAGHVKGLGQAQVHAHHGVRAYVRGHARVRRQQADDARDGHRLDVEVEAVDADAVGEVGLEVDMSRARRRQADGEVLERKGVRLALVPLYVAVQAEGHVARLEIFQEDGRVDRAVEAQVIERRPVGVEAHFLELEQRLGGRHAVEVADWSRVGDGETARADVGEVGDFEGLGRLLARREDVEGVALGVEHDEVGAGAVEGDVVEDEVAGDE